MACSELSGLAGGDLRLLYSVFSLLLAHNTLVEILLVITRDTLSPSYREHR